MTDEDTSELPYYKIPYTEIGAAYVGMFVATWSQIDHFMLECIAKMLGTEIGAALILMENMTSGPKLNLFNRLAKGAIKDAEIEKARSDFYKEISPLIEKRNHIMHGMWGFWISDDYTKEEAGAFYPKGNPKELLISEIPLLTKRAAIQTHNLLKIRQYLYCDQWTWDPARQPVFRFSHNPPNESAKHSQLIDARP